MNASAVILLLSLLTGTTLPVSLRLCRLAAVAPAFEVLGAPTLRMCGDYVRASSLSINRVRVRQTHVNDIFTTNPESFAYVSPLNASPRCDIKVRIDGERPYAPLAFFCL